MIEGGREDWKPELESSRAGAESEEATFSYEDEISIQPDISKARLVLTEPRPAGFGEVLVTEVWGHPESDETEVKKAPVEEASDRQRKWEIRQELRSLGLIRERPLVSYDVRLEQYWGQAKDVIDSASDAILDPYTELAAQFADADVEGIREHVAAAREYGRAGDELLELGRAYIVIGRQKDARSMLEMAARAEPQDPRIWYNLGVVSLFSRATKRAREALKKAVDQAPGDFRSQLALGCACYHGKDYAAAAEHFRRLVGADGFRATARSWLACCHRMQGKWDEARVELGFLQDATPGDWDAMANQCLDCVERGEQKLRGPMRMRRRAAHMWKALAAVAAGGIWIAYGLAQDLFREQFQWAMVPVFVLVLLLMRTLRRISGGELPDEFGNAEQGLPCWQATTWMRPRQSEF